MTKVFKIKLSDEKKAVLSKVNTLKGLYGIIQNKDKNEFMYKLVSAREYKKNKNRISLAVLVQPSVKEFNEGKWLMTRINAKRSGELIVGTYSDAILEILSTKVV